MCQALAMTFAPLGRTARSLNPLRCCSHLIQWIRPVALRDGSGNLRGNCLESLHLRRKQAIEHWIMASLSPLSSVNACRDGHPPYSSSSISCGNGAMHHASCRIFCVAVSFLAYSLFPTITGNDRSRKESVAPPLKPHSARNGVPPPPRPCASYASLSQKLVARRRTTNQAPTEHGTKNEPKKHQRRSRALVLRLSAFLASGAMGPPRSAASRHEGPLVPG